MRTCSGNSLRRPNSALLSSVALQFLSDKSDHLNCFVTQRANFRTIRANNNPKHPFNQLIPNSKRQFTHTPLSRTANELNSNATKAHNNHIRTSSDILNMTSAPAIPASFSDCKDNKERFIHSFAIIKEYLIADAVENMALAGNRKEYVKKMMDVTCLGGKYNRGITVVDVVDNLSKDLEGEAKERLLFEGCVCGWMIEMLQAHFLVEDDIMDDSKTRRDKPCWYLFPGVTTQSAINDGLIVLAMATEIAFHYLGYKPTALMSILKEFHRTDYRTTMGQLYDVTSMRNDADIDAEKKQHPTTDFSEYNMDSFKRIVKYKTAYYTYHLPLVMGLAICSHLTSATAGVCPKDTEQIAMVMGEYFQAQDDFMDCFTDPVILGKIGTDIEDMKCSWLAANFVMTATPAQLDTFKANYGKHDPACVATIKALYNEANMKEKFEAYENNIATEVGNLLEKMEESNSSFAAACRNLWNKTYKRSK